MARDTKKKILTASLALFNELGEPNVTTNAIATSIDISPGNLHYHFSSKKDIVLALFHEYEQGVLELQATPPDRCAELEDVWLLFHLSFERMGQYQFIYRDLTDLCGRYPVLHRRLLGLRTLTQQTLSLMIDDLRASGIMTATQEEQQTLVESFILISHFWLANDRIRSPGGEIHPNHAVALIMRLMSPLIIPQAKTLLSDLASSYR